MGRLVTTPDAVWSGLLSTTGYARRHGLGATLGLVGRPPLGVAIAVMLVTFVTLTLFAIMN
jgi:hypothetical protein